MRGGRSPPRETTSQHRTCSDKTKGCSAAREDAADIRQGPREKPSSADGMNMGRLGDGTTALSTVLRLVFWQRSVCAGSQEYAREGRCGLLRKRRVRDGH